MKSGLIRWSPCKCNYTWHAHTCDYFRWFWQSLAKCLEIWGSNLGTKIWLTLPISNRFWENAKWNLLQKRYFLFTPIHYLFTRTILEQVLSLLVGPGWILYDRWRLPSLIPPTLCIFFYLVFCFVILLVSNDFFFVDFLTSEIFDFWTRFLHFGVLVFLVSLSSVCVCVGGGRLTLTSSCYLWQVQNFLILNHFE